VRTTGFLITFIREEGKNSNGVPIYKIGAKESWKTKEKLAILM
jgi:hypothetical protein